MGRTSDGKEKLLGVAFDLVRNSSSGSVSVDLICDLAGVNTGGFYRFFLSKADQSEGRTPNLHRPPRAPKRRHATHLNAVARFGRSISSRAPA